MKRPVLVNLYFDQHSGLENVADEAFVVVDAQSYATARRAIEKMKAGEIPAPVTIIVRSRSFFGGFHDLSLLGDLAQVTHIAPRAQIVEALHVEVPDNLTDPDLIALGVRNHEDLLEAAGPHGVHDRTSFDDALLAKAFHTQVFRISAVRDFTVWFGDLIDFLYSDETPAKSGWNVSYTWDLAEERVRTILQRFRKGSLLPLVADVLGRAADGQAQLYLNQLAVRYWLKDYPKLARKAVVDNITERVGRWQDVTDEVDLLGALAPWCEALYAQAENPLIDRLEHVLGLLLGVDGLIEAEDLGQRIQQMSGRFAAEYGDAQARLGQLLLQHRSADAAPENRAVFLAYSTQIESRFTPLLQRAGRPPHRADWIDSFLELTEVMSHLEDARPSRWADWCAAYELLIKAKQLRREVEELVPRQYAEGPTDLGASFATLDERLNSEFGDWLLAEYPNLVTSTLAQPPLVMTAARLALDSVARGDTVILLVIDALDWELWRYLRSRLSSEGLVVRGDEVGLAMIPTITEFSRRAIFGGMPPRTLAGFVDDIYGTEIAPWEEARTLARALGYLSRVDQLRALRANKRILYLEDALVYVNGSEKDFRQALELNAKCYAFVYTEIDSHVHVSKMTESKLKATAMQWLSDLVAETVQGIQQNSSLRDHERLKVIVTSDHGFVDVSEQSQVKTAGPLREFLDLERHGRLAIARVKAEQDATTAVQTVRAFHGEDPLTWHVIWREQADRFGLAESSPSEGQVIAWLMPRLLQYVSRGRGRYVHGGLSMYEAIVPIAVLTKGIVDIEAPIVTITGRLISEEESLLSVAILNKNDRPLQELALDIPELGLSRLRTRDIEPGNVGKLVVPIIPPKSGEVSVQVTLDAEIGGIQKRFQETRVVTVLPGRRERMRLSTRRTLHDEE
jgi:hypothetical protein